MKFNEDDLKRIREAAAAAETNTSGEIASAVINESSDYAYFELLFAVIGSGLWFLIMMFLYGRVAGWLEGIFWGGAGARIAGFYGLSTLIVGGVLYVLANIPGVDRLIVPKRVIAQRVRRRAQVHFMDSGVYNTRDRTGILLFISLKERRVELLADAGINAKVEQGAWDGIVSDLAGAIKADRTAEGLVEAITACGGLLSEYFPIKADDTNELPDGLVFLED